MQSKDKMLNRIRPIFNVKKYRFWMIFSFIIISGIYWALTFMYVYEYSPIRYAEMNGFYFTIASLLLSTVLAILTALNIGILMYKLDSRKKANKGFFGLGTLAGIAGTGCPTCGALLASLVGAPLGLMFLPLKGLEFKLVGIVALIVALHFSTKDISCKKC